MARPAVLSAGGAVEVGATLGGELPVPVVTDDGEPEVVDVCVVAGAELEPVSEAVVGLAGSAGPSVDVTLVVGARGVSPLLLVSAVQPAMRTRAAAAPAITSGTTVRRTRSHTGFPHFTVISVLMPSPVMPGLQVT